jgi:predicted nucleic acid-binding protein
MVIACDTSFLFSLYGSDVHSTKAVVWSVKNTRALYLNSLVHFEFGNELRFSEFRQAVPAGAAVQYWAGFEAAIAHGRLIFATPNLADVVDEAKRISSMRTLSGGYRGFDILHVAGALRMNATHFLTFDADQKKLAEAEGLIVPL